MVLAVSGMMLEFVALVLSLSLCLVMLSTALLWPCEKPGSDLSLVYFSSFFLQEAQIYFLFQNYSG